MTRRAQLSLALDVSPSADALGLVPDWRPAEPIPEDAMAAPADPPKPKRKGVKAWQDRPYCPDCKKSTAAPTTAHHEPGRWYGPPNANLFCPACGKAWVGSPAEVALAERAEKAWEREQAREERAAKRAERRQWEEDRMAELRGAK